MSASKQGMPRREFVKRTAAGVAGATLTGVPAASYAKIPGASERVRIGVVGFSDRFNDSLLPAIAAVGKDQNFEIVAMPDIWSRRREEGVAAIEKVAGVKARPLSHVRGRVLGLRAHVGMEGDAGCQQRRDIQRLRGAVAHAGAGRDRLRVPDSGR